MRTRIEVLAARNTVQGCCERFADQMPCNCLKEAVSTDDPNSPFCSCPDCVEARQDMERLRNMNLLEQCEHGRREWDCALCTMQKRSKEFDQHVDKMAKAEGREMQEQVGSINQAKCEHGILLDYECRQCSFEYGNGYRTREKTVFARRLELMHLAQELVKWAEAKGVKAHEIPLLRRMVDLLLEAE